MLNPHILKKWKVFMRVGELVIGALSLKGFKSKLLTPEQFRKITTKVIYDVFTEAVLNIFLPEHNEWNKKIRDPYWFNETKEHGPGDPNNYMKDPKLREDMSEIDKKLPIELSDSDDDLIKIFNRYKDMHKKEGVIIRVSEDGEKITIHKVVNQEIKDWRIFVETALSITGAFEEWGFKPRKESEYITDLILMYLYVNFFYRCSIKTTTLSKLTCLGESNSWTKKTKVVNNIAKW
ncbi:hypothetical protein FACS189472_15610 [Alphaproteobacteria bacterium]|nr:hypothetical protein FACS189472_15610 [Alphaproteobacteria bacterium]